MRVQTTIYAIFAIIYNIFQLVLCEKSNTIFAVNGFGKPVQWWYVIKFPAVMKHQDGSIAPTVCDCRAPDCSNVSNGADTSTRGSGLCYLYADSDNPALRHFRDLNYDCLGQGGNDPVSQTIKLMQASPSNSWAMYNDQYNGVASGASGNECGKGPVFNAHSKGAIGFDNRSGVILQSTTPNFPDPTISSDKKMTRLGCQLDNNVKFAQHFYSMSLSRANIETIGASFQSAGLCSYNFYQKRITNAKLFSDSFDKSSSMYKALIDSTLAAKPTQHIKVQTNPTTSIPNTITVDVIVKNGGLSQIPPWALVVEELHTDLSVASWWSNTNGIPTICALDNYQTADKQFCLDSGNLFTNGTAKYNIENVVQASWIFNNNQTYYWSLYGGVTSNGNHGKWAISTPRSSTIFDPNYVVFGDMNMEGFPCSPTCGSSQGGRGGLFFSFPSKSLHDSVKNLITDVVSCEKVSNTKLSFQEARQRGYGCKTLSVTHLPAMSAITNSFWQLHKSNLKSETKKTEIE